MHGSVPGSVVYLVLYLVKVCVCVPRFAPHPGPAPVSRLQVQQRQVTSASVSVLHQTAGPHRPHPGAAAAHVCTCLCRHICLKPCPHPHSSEHFLVFRTSLMNPLKTGSGPGNMIRTERLFWSLSFPHLLFLLPSGL